MTITVGSLQACIQDPVTSAMGQQTTMNAHDFENHVLKRLVALRPGWTVKKAPEPFQLTIRRVREGDLRFNLDSFYQQYRDQPVALDRLFAARLRRLGQVGAMVGPFGPPLLPPLLHPPTFPHPPHPPASPPHLFSP